MRDQARQAPRSKTRNRSEAGPGAASAQTSHPSERGKAVGSTLVIGLGNPILGDDGVGLRVVGHLRQLLGERADVSLEEDTHGGLRLMERLVGFNRAIVIDAIITGAAPGTLFELAVADMPTAHSGSSHDMSFADALAMGRHIGAALPEDPDISLIGIEAADILTFQEECSAEVEAAIPSAAARVLELLEQSHGRPYSQALLEGDSPEEARRRRELNDHLSRRRDSQAEARRPGEKKNRHQPGQLERLHAQSPTDNPQGERTMISPEILRRYPYFATADGEAAKAIAMISKEISIGKGETLFREGEFADKLYVIKSGEIDLVMTLNDGKQVVLETQVAGDLLGLSAVSGPGGRRYTCVARTDMTLVSIDGEKLMDLCNKDTALGFRLMSEVVKALNGRLDGSFVQLAAAGD